MQRRPAAEELTTLALELRAAPTLGVELLPDLGPIAEGVIATLLAPTLHTRWNQARAWLKDRRTEDDAPSPSNEATARKEALNAALAMKIKLDDAHAVSITATDSGWRAVMTSRDGATLELMFFSAVSVIEVRIVEPL
jgi:hypothetical protein